MEDKDVEILTKLVLKHDQLLSAISKHLADVVTVVMKTTVRCIDVNCDRPATLRHKANDGDNVDNVWCDHCAAKIISDAEKSLASPESKDYDEFLVKTLQENSDLTMWSDIEVAEPIRRLNSFIEILNDIRKTH